MTHVLSAHFDGKVIVPDEPVQIPVGTPLRIQVEVQEGSQRADGNATERAGDTVAPRFARFLDLAANLPDAPPDLAAQHDHYLYGSPKR